MSLGSNAIPTHSFEKWRFVYWSSENAVALNLLENCNFLFGFHCIWKWIKYLWRSISRNIKSKENRMLDFTTVFIHEDIWFIISSSFWRKNITHIYNVIIVQIQKLQKNVSFTQRLSKPYCWSFPGSELSNYVV